MGLNQMSHHKLNFTLAKNQAIKFRSQRLQRLTRTADWHGSDSDTAPSLVKSSENLKTKNKLVQRV